MKYLATLMVGLVALEHIGILILEMFYWDHAVGAKVFNQSREFMASTKVLGANQGLYNGFLAAGLIWALVANRNDLKYFFLGCVVVAGVFGAMTAKFSILYTQALPATIALVLVLLVRKQGGTALSA